MKTTQYFKRKLQIPDSFFLKARRTATPEYCFQHNEIFISHIFNDPPSVETLVRPRRWGVTMECLVYVPCTSCAQPHTMYHTPNFYRKTHFGPRKLESAPRTTWVITNLWFFFVTLINHHKIFVPHLDYEEIIFYCLKTTTS